MSIFGMNGEGLQRGLSRYANDDYKRDADGKFSTGGGGGKNTPGQKGFKDVFKGDEIEYTGKTQTAYGREYLEFTYLEGHKKGQTGLAPKPDDKKADVERTQKEWKKEQEGFRRLRETSGKK